MKALDKNTIREVARAARRNQADPAARSDEVGSHLLSMPLYQSCRSVMWYVGVRDEVCTRNAIKNLLCLGKQTLSVPFCDGDDLVAVELRDWHELETGKYGILEPSDELRHDETRRIPAAALDGVIVPGIAFDRQGGRVGHGAGYYDRFLARTHATCWRFGLAFDAQVFEEVPMEHHDIRMNWLVTPSGVNDCR